MTRLIKVKDYMTRATVALKPGMAVLDAVHALVQNGISGAPVLDDQGEILGMLTERDCLKLSLSAGYYGSGEGRVAEYMSGAVETVDAEMSIVDLAQQFLKRPFRRYPVMEGGRMVGIISRRDVLRGLLER